MPNFLSPTKQKLVTPTKDVRCRCNNYPNCGIKCALRSAPLLPPRAGGEDLPSDLVIGLSLVGLEKAEKEVARRKRSANDTRLTRSNNATPFVKSGAEDGSEFPTIEVVIRTPKSTGTLKLCSHCGSPAGPFMPTKLPKSSRTQRSLTFDDEPEILRDTSQSSDVDVVKLTPVLENFLSKKPLPVCHSPPIAASSPIITPERKNKLASSGLEVDATRVTGEFEISACVPPSPPLPEEFTPPELGFRLKRNPILRRRISQRSVGRSLADRLSAIAERPPPPARKEIRGTDVVSMLHQVGEFGIVLAKIMSHVEEDDLCAMTCVSRTWREVIFCQPEAMQRRVEFLKIKRIWMHSPDAENSRMLRGYLRSPSVIRPKSTVEIRGYLEKAFQSVLPPPAAPSNANRRMSLTLGINNRRSPRRGPHTLPRAQSESEGRFWAFVQEGRKLHEGERLAQCPMCRSPARVIPGKVMAECTETSCGYSFCPHCRIGSPRRCCRSTEVKGEKTSPENNGSSPAKSWRSTPSIGSRKSKRSLRRLVEK